MKPRTLKQRIATLERQVKDLRALNAPPKYREGTVVLTYEEASDGATYQAALKKVYGDHSKIIVTPRWDWEIR